MSSPARKRVAILISGRGSNMRALLDAAAEPRASFEIVGVLSDRADAGGLNHAAAAGIRSAAIERKGFADKAAHEAAIEAKLAEWGVDLVALAGFMRLLSPGFTQRWAGRMVNIHPSLLPLFKGLDTHRRALDAGMRVHGCTVHFVTAEMDGGPIIGQAAIGVSPHDDEQALMRRVLAAEHRLYPAVLELVASGRIRLVDGRVVCDAGLDAPEGILASPRARSSDPLDIEELARITP